jgi:hypothetical protein
LNIREILRSRSDLSTFLVHFTRDLDDISGKDRLRLILQQHTIKATKPMGHAVRRLSDSHLSANSQRCVSFTETPLEYAHLLIEDIEGRDCHFRPYGIAIPKKLGRRYGFNPVWYVDITPGHNWLSGQIEVLIDNAIQSGNFDESEIGKLTPFIEQMGTGPGYRKEFWWEREWRCAGDYLLPRKTIVLCPEIEHAEFNEILETGGLALSCKFVDPFWSLEQIIARLAGFSADEVDVFE